MLTTRTQARVRSRVSKRGVVFALLLIAYLFLTLGVMFRSPVLRLDTDLVNLNLRHQYPEWKPWIDKYVIFGQRGPATLVLLPFFLWVSWRTRSSRPLVLLAVSFVLLNLSVGIVKLATGRLGPRQTTHAHEILVGGDIYPSGHVSNAVVLYGLVALIVIGHRKPAIGAAVFLSVTVGLGTVYLDTHWFSDVVGGWFAGGLVLLALPTVMPAAQRGVDALTKRLPARFRPGAGSTEIEMPPASLTPPSAQLPEAGPVHRKATPVSSAARSHSVAATPASRDALDDRTRCG